MVIQQRLCTEVSGNEGSWFTVMRTSLSCHGDQKKQCNPPEKKKRVSRSYINEVKRWGVNSAKWKYAMDYAENRGWKFKILTEEVLFK